MGREEVRASDGEFARPRAKGVHLAPIIAVCQLNGNTDARPGKLQSLRPPGHHHETSARKAGPTPLLRVVKRRPPPSPGLPARLGLNPGRHLQVAADVGRPTAPLVAGPYVEPEGPLHRRVVDAPLAGGRGRELDPGPVVDLAGANLGHDEFV